MIDDETPSPSPGLPGTLELGAFSVSLNVADLDASQTFYEALGFVVVHADEEQRYRILKNGETTLGIFRDVIPANVLTFNPGLASTMEQLETFTDVREIQQHLEDAGITLTERVEDADGPGHLTVVDPDGNTILIDQFF